MEKYNNFLSIYRALEHDLKNDFFVPLLENAVYYRSATGFFTLSGLAELIDSIIPILKKGGKVEILTSPLLQQEDVERMEDSVYDKDFIESIILDEIESYNLYENDIDLELNLLASLIKEEIIELKIVYATQGIFHDKTGYVDNIYGKTIAYNGSANLTYSGLYSNIESISVYTEGRNDDSIASTKDYLDKLWNSKYSKIKVLDLDNAINSKLLEFQNNSYSIDTLIKKVESKTKGFINADLELEIAEEKSVSLRDYQKEAINQFIKNDFVHFFEMATGTGKTFTALFALQELDKKVNGPLFTIVILPWVDLMFQWKESAEKANIPGKIFGLGGGAHSGTASSVFDRALQEFINGENVIIFAVSKSYQLHSRNFFKSYWTSIRDHLFIIIDESHNITNAVYNSLPKAKYRLGLSATPKRGDETETENILSYFRGPIFKETFKYGLKEAIDNNFLSKYYYYPMFVHLTEDEYEQYEKETIIIARYLDYKNDEEKERLDRALLRRALIVKKADGKIDKLKEMLKTEHYDFTNSVIYCGPGNLNEEIKMTDYITKIVREFGKYDVTKFVSGTENRDQVLKEFAQGYFDTMVAIKCFDEGIDVPSLSRIFILSSDNNYRQTVQRRGRVLRVSKETGKEFADIYDYIVLPPLGVPYKNVTSLIKNEMARLVEYASLSENYDDNEQTIESILKESGLKMEEIIYES